MGNTQIPAELVLQIVSHANHNDIPALCEAVQTISLDDALHYKNDPHRYLKQLAPETEDLMRLMRKHSVVISGSRGAGYFYDDACTVDSDWDFYCSSGDSGAMVFAHSMTKLGAFWLQPPDIFEQLDRDYEKDIAGYGSGFQVMTGGLNGNRIQLVWRPGTSAFRQIVEFHSSIVQCFISGYCAVSMYHSASSRGELVGWALDGDSQRGKRVTAPGCVSKYVARGFTKVDYRVGHTSCPPAFTHDKPITYRAISDAGCMVVDFEQYTSASMGSPERLTHRASMKEILTLSWTEVAGAGGSCSLSTATGCRLDSLSELFILRRLGQRQPADVLRQRKVAVPRQHRRDWPIETTITTSGEDATELSWAPVLTRTWRTYICEHPIRYRPV